MNPADRLPKARQEFKCDNCRGEGTVPLRTCRGCGRAAMEWDNQHGVEYCGRDKCWENLVEIVDLTKKPVITTFEPWRGGGYTRTNYGRDFRHLGNGVVGYTNAQGVRMVHDRDLRVSVTEEDWKRNHGSFTQAEIVAMLQQDMTEDSMEGYCC